MKKVKRSKEKIRAYNLKYRHGITIEEYNKILKKQNYRCAICQAPQSKFQRHLAVDHNHKTKRIRGLLCCYCNRQLLKYFRDDRKRVEGFIKYFSKELKNDISWKE